MPAGSLVASLLRAATAAAVLAPGAGAADVVLLQRRYSAAPGLEGADCHTAVEGERCHAEVDWARRHGFPRFPAWYPGLSAASSFEDFQRHLAGRVPPVCPPPCAGVALDSSPGQHGGPQPMGACQGDCDSDQDCAGHLRCLQREALEAVPGCEGVGLSGFDYCYDPSGGNATPSPSPTTEAPGTTPGKPLDSSPGRHGRAGMAECQGDCDADGDCEGALRCFQRDGQTPVPGCSGGGLAGFDYCYDPLAPGETGPSTSLPVTTVATATHAPVGADVRIKLVAFNVYYASLGTEKRLEGISDAIAHMQADIAVIAELWDEKPDLLARVREKSGRNYVFCTGGRQEEMWDGDILFDSDLWERLDDGVEDWGCNRGLSWASLKHKATGQPLLVYGAHPVCCGHEDIHLGNAEAFAEHVLARPERPDAPVVLMGDLNAGEEDSSIRAYQGEAIRAYNREWQLPFALADSFREPPANRFANAHTFHSGWRFDYIFTEKRSPPVFETVAASIWRDAPGGSDHWPITAEVVLKR